MWNRGKLESDIEILFYLFIIFTIHISKKRLEAADTELETCYHLLLLKCFIQIFFKRSRIFAPYLLFLKYPQITRLKNGFIFFV